VRKLRDLVKGREAKDVPAAEEKVEGRVHAMEIRPVEHNSVLAWEVSDSTGDLTALFYGRSHIAGVICGSLVRLRGPVGIRDGRPVMINPAYEHVGSGTGQ
jgi:hypothetical protein